MTGEADSAMERRFSSYTGRMGALLRLPVQELQEAGLLVGLAVSTKPGAREITVGRTDRFLGIGKIRLDNRDEIARLAGPRWTGTGPSERGDIGVVLAALETAGPQIFEALSGDFALIIWDRERGTLMVLRDWLGLRRVFFTADGDSTVIASDADLLSLSEEFDSETAIEYLAFTNPTGSSRTIWRGVRHVPPGSCLRVTQQGRREDRIQSLWEVSCRSSAPEGAAGRFQQLFDQAVRQHLSGNRATWSELSGGVDSTSIVMTAHWLASQRAGCPVLGGTYTWTDTLHAESQEPFYTEIARACGRRTRRIEDYHAWQDDHSDPPVTDEPRRRFMFWARNRASRNCVRHEGGSVVLGGDGSDHYLANCGRQIGDLFRSGQKRMAFRDALARAVDRQDSIWKQLRRALIVPLLPEGVAQRARATIGGSPSWLTRAARRVAQARSGIKYPNIDRAVAAELGEHGDGVRRSLYRVRAILEVQPRDDHIDRRYPFLDRSLLAFCLSLPLSLKVGCGRSKWLLRDGMAGRLPPSIRERTSNTTITPRFVWSLRERQRLLSSMMRDPLLAQMGWVEPKSLRAAVDLATAGSDPGISHLMSALSLETWLLVRLGLWDRICSDTRDRPPASTVPGDGSTSSDRRSLGGGSNAE